MKKQQKQKKQKTEEVAPATEEGSAKDKASQEETNGDSSNAAESKLEK